MRIAPQTNLSLGGRLFRTQQASGQFQWLGTTAEHGLPLLLAPSLCGVAQVYETTAAIILFSILWLLRKRINTTGIIFSIYLMMNGFERFWIEKIRVNAEFDLLGITMTQAELIATILMVSGAILFLYLRKNSKTA